MTAFDELLKGGLAASSAGDTERAIDLFTQAAALNPQAAAPHFLAGSEYAASGKVAQAEQSFSQALLLEPGSTVMRYQLGLLQFSSARIPQAMLTWQPMLNLPEEDAFVHFIRGFSCAAAGKLPEALNHFAHGLPLNAQFPAISDDIRMVMRALEAIDGKAPGIGAASTTNAEPSAEKATHLLFAHYQKQGTLH